MDSILNSIKTMIGLTEDYHAFDTQLLPCINSAIATLTQIGIGSPNGFIVTNADVTWNDFIGGSKNLENVKTYVYLKTKLIFDPPQNSSITELIKEQIRELEWRLNVTVDPGEVI